MRQWALLGTLCYRHFKVLYVFRDWDRGRERRRDYDRGRRERFSPPRHISPQHKRMRRDWWVFYSCVYQFEPQTGHMPELIQLLIFEFSRDDHRGEPYHYDLPYGGGGAPFPGAGPQGWHPDLPHLHPPHGGHLLQGRWAHHQLSPFINQYS